MATSSSKEEKAKKKAGKIGVIYLKKDCPHVESLVAGIRDLSIDMSQPCGVCGNVGENCLCLKCSKVYCSHDMVHHNTQNPTHEIVLSFKFSDLSFCYACDSYIDSPHLESILRAATTAKFDPPTKRLMSEATTDTDRHVPGTSSGKNRGERDPVPEALSQSDPQKNPPKACVHLESSLEKDILLSRMRATIYGNCIGDAIGLLTEFMTKEEAHQIYGTTVKDRKKHASVEKLQLEYSMKYDDLHRSRWQVGDWTDDSDQMILIMRTLLDKNGKADILDYAEKFKVWTRNGYKELGDHGGMGIGTMTSKVVKKREFSTDPHKCACQVWEDSRRWAAPNGGVMRTSILGIQDFSDIPTVIDNTRKICKVTHADPRCIASCVAVTTAIALMLQGKHRKRDEYDEMAICEKAYKYACHELEKSKEKEELRRHMFARKLSQLELSGDDKIGYTYKCLGAGFWAFRQKDFRLALTEVIMEGGDADTNGAVAGALLGCKLGVEYIPETWLNGLRHKEWLDEQMDKYFVLLGLEEDMKRRQNIAHTTEC